MHKMIVGIIQMNLIVQQLQKHARLMTLHVAMASVCHVPGFVMETMTVEIAQMKHQSNVLPRPAAATSLLVVIETVSLCAGDVMEMEIALTILMRKDALIRDLLLQVAQEKCSVVLMELASKVTGAVTEKVIVLMALMRMDAQLVTAPAANFLLV